jgi:hypothetical protein
MDTDDSEDEMWDTDDTELRELKDDLESLTRLEKIALKRQEQIEHRIEDVADDGVPKSRIRRLLRLSKPTLERILIFDPPKLHERLGLSPQSTEAITDGKDDI